MSKILYNFIQRDSQLATKYYTSRILGHFIKQLSRSRSYLPWVLKLFSLFQNTLGISNVLILAQIWTKHKAGNNVA